MTLIKLLGYRLKKIRRQMGLTQLEFAKEIGIDKNTLWNYEKDRRSPDSNTLKKIYDISNVNLNWLITGKGSMLLPNEFKKVQEIDHISDFKKLEALKFYLRQIELLYTKTRKKTELKNSKNT